jgi:hypothetical protein
MGIENIINSQIALTNSRLRSAGFGTPLILPATVPGSFGSDRIRFYSTTDEMLDDGFTTADLAYVEAAGIEAQKPHPTRWAVGRRSTPVAQVVTVTVTAAVDAAVYALSFDDSVNTETISHTAPGSSTINGIAASLRTAVNASTYLGVTASGSGADVVLTADSAGIPFVVTESSPNMSLVVTTANVGIPEDITAIENASEDWYGLLITARDPASIMATAAAIETRKKLFFAQSDDATITSAADSSGSITSTSDVASRLKAKNYFRTSLWEYASDAVAHASMVFSSGLADVAGSRTWAFKETIGSTARRYTTTERTNLTSKNANGYEPIAGRSVTFNGTVASGEFIDVIHGRDALDARILELCLLSQLKNKKIDFTTEGIDIFAANVRAALEEFSKPTRRYIARSRRNATTGEVETPAYTVTPPLITDIADADRAARRIPEAQAIQWEATLAGAIHLVNIRGTLSV